jgi:hypothetical protein
MSTATSFSGRVSSASRATLPPLEHAELEHPLGSEAADQLLVGLYRPTALLQHQAVGRALHGATGRAAGELRPVDPEVLLADPLDHPRRW